MAALMAVRADCAPDVVVRLNPFRWTEVAERDAIVVLIVVILIVVLR